MNSSSVYGLKLSVFRGVGAKALATDHRVCVFECTIVNLATYRQFTNTAWDWIIQKKKEKEKKEIKIAVSLGYPNSHFYNKRCNMLL